MRYIDLGAIIQTGNGISFARGCGNTDDLAFQKWLTETDPITGQLNTPDPDPNIVQKTKDAFNAPIMAQITSLEASITQRRIREHLMGVDTTFIPNVDSQITALRLTLQV